MLASPDIASRRWIWEQYDHKVGGDTIQPPGGDAALVRVHGTNKALAITTDCNPRYCYADPYEGGKQAIAEAYRNISATGATPLAVTNCLNFANPQRPEIMAQIVGCLEGMSDACRALDFPIVSGNVSLYNESKATGGGSAILPTPAIGAVGLIQDWRKAMGIGFPNNGLSVLVIGWGAGHLGQSSWLRVVHGREDGVPPPVDLSRERLNGEFVRRLISAGLVAAVHDLSDGGLAVALSEMALAGSIGAEVTIEIGNADGHFAMDAFGEDQAVYVVATTDEDGVKRLAREVGAEVDWIGVTGGTSLILKRFDGPMSKVEIPLADLRAAHEGFFPALMGADAALA